MGSAAGGSDRSYVALFAQNDKETRDVNLNNIPGLDEKMFCELFEGLRANDNLVRLSAANCAVNDFAATTLALAIEHNTSLKSLNLESNRVTDELMPCGITSTL